MSHTPGPWRLLGPKQINESKLVDGVATVVVFDDYAIEMQPGGRGTIIVEVFGRCAENTFPNARENAMLIAAAPEMLEQLKNVKRLFHLEACPCPLCEIILKAEGR